MSNETALVPVEEKQVTFGKPYFRVYNKHGKGS